MLSHLFKATHDVNGCCPFLDGFLTLKERP
ncbi:MAG: hypothetical protein GMKNLPBB_02349 [Myxococcota bacterium]|nr:hypothetical protein [Myxococcota bacterium]